MSNRRQRLEGDLTRGADPVDVARDLADALEAAEAGQKEWERLWSQAVNEVMRLQAELAQLREAARAAFREWDSPVPDFTMRRLTMERLRALLDKENADE